MRFELNQDEVAAIGARLPDNTRILRVRALAPDFLSSGLPQDSRLGVACVPFHDTVRMLNEARFLFSEALSQLTWYRNHHDPPCEMEAVFFSNIFLDDVCLRLFAASEHLGNACLDMFDIDPETPRKLRGFKRAGWLKRVIGTLRDIDSARPVCDGVARVLDTDAWDRAMTIRHDWVHNQPLRLAGRGISYERGMRWQGNTLAVGAGDLTPITIDEYVVVAEQALSGIWSAANTCVECYFDLLESKGICIDRKSGSATISL